jgi:inner membrane transporter RhtA
MHFAYSSECDTLVPMSRITGISLMTTSAASSQVGAATAVLAFPVLGPAGVVAIRQWVAGAVLFCTVRPSFASFTGRQWRPVLALAVIFGTMNLSLYLAISRIGLGLAVTLEFLGPLSVALIASRRLLDLLGALIASAAVVVLARPSASTDYGGIGLALLAAACWAGYILVNRVVGARIPGAQGPATAACLSACAYVPFGLWVLISHPVTLVAVGRAAVAGVLCSAVPMVADLRALRLVPTGFYGVFMSVNPVFAALTGLVVLGQRLGLADWLSIGAIVTVNAVSGWPGVQAAADNALGDVASVPEVEAPENGWLSGSACARLGRHEHDQVGSGDRFGVRRHLRGHVLAGGARPDDQPARVAGR